MHNHHYLLWGLSVTLSLGTAVQVQAQLVPDNTLGEENSIITPVDSLKNQIDGGAIRGSNLFHSFKEFNIGNGKSVYFNNPGAIQNILTRVTGSNPSSILGKLGVLGNANLFLINPNGVIFGQNASLDISGSFTATTTPSIWFDNSLEFSATNPQAPPLLKIDITPGLQYPRHQAQNIKYQNIQLRDINLQDIISQGNLTVGKDLNLVGKNLNLTGKLNAGRDLKLQASDTLKIRDSVNLPFIADASRDLLLQGNQSVNIFALNHPDSGLFSGNNLVLQSAKPVLGDARYFSGGNFRIEQLDGNLGDLESPNDPIIRASGDVSFDSYTGASLHILAGGSVNIAGDVTITGADGENGLEDIVTLSTGESLEINGKTQATLDIRAGTTAFGTTGVTGSDIFIPENPSIGESPSSRDVVIGGNIRVDSANGLVFLTNQYSADSSLSSGDIRVEGDIDISSTSGNGGRITIDTSGDISTQDLNSSSEGGNGGAITLDAGGNIETQSLQSYSYSEEGNGGVITLDAGGDIKTQYLESFSSNNAVNAFNAGNGGVITLDAGGNIETQGLNSNSYSFSLSDGGNAGNGGTIILNARDGNISTQNLDSSSSSVYFPDVDNAGNSGSAGNGGAIKLTAGGNIETQDLDSFSLSEKDHADNGGVITLDAGGNINTQDLDSFSLSEEGNAGNGGTITITAKNGDINGLTSPSSVFASFSVSDKGNAGTGGQVTLEAKNKITNLEILTLSSDSNSGEVQLTGFGDLSVINTNIITSKQLQIKIKHPLNNEIRSLNLDIGNEGQSGDVTVIGNGNLSFNNSRIESDTKGNNPAGNVNITSSNLLTFNNSFVISNTNSTGSAGSLAISADGGKILIDKSELSAQTNAQGDAGNITLNSSELTLKQQAQISTSTTADSKAGNITIDATNSINLLNSSKLVSEATSNATAGNINITTNQLRINDNSQANVSSKANGSAGSISIDAGNVNLSQGAKISATTESGNGSGITLDGLASLSLNDSEISASTTDGKAGNIEINATDSVKLSDRSTITSEARNSGIAGTLIINTNQFIINNSQLNVSSPSGQAGGLSIMADNLYLNKSELTAETGVRKGADGANINLKIKDLLWMENESLISAKAWNNANGGNITINNSEGFVIGLPFENSDVIANAKEGNGGNIKVNTQNIFGLVFRQQRTAKSDITASSKFGVNGQVTVNQLNVDPSSGLVELPSNLEETTKIKSGCATSAVNNFIVSGKGGLPQSPDDLFTGKTTNTELFDLVPNDSQISSNISASNRNINAEEQKNQVPKQNQVLEKNKILEATGLVFDADGNVELVARIPEFNSHHSGIYSVSCKDFSAVSK
ncbi:two-partner secretion domain-containing protein [Mastigocoleus testarum]|uniref:Filamentous haemagglutinin FhaB/tRNA nuclease CdiA-like TPS domain-containing protein n=1 Tax=Mastigocoleus testarum BC008 TaxID=371196 RepID=A0A0V7ZMQ8_9CYAN|nr:filamentous hemagglutinin N-terminal domain-containing protein [Mastigocoleus testarum]KST65761.1 hypothetical protein BC008_22550 [Mastigocoleus testarum BC008]